MTAVKEHIKWLVDFKVEKYEEDVAGLVAARLDIPKEFVQHRELWTPGFEDRLAVVNAEVLSQLKPWEVIEREGNMLLNEGINGMWKLICGGTETAFNNTNARIGVGNGTTAASASQTGLQGASTAFAAMEASFPTYGTSQKATFKSSFGTSVANFAWEEWTIDNGSSANVNLNRKVEALGTKSSGTWTLTVDITLA